MAENSKGIIALNAVVTGTEQIKNLRTQLDNIIRTGGGKVKLEAETTITGTKVVKQELEEAARAFDMYQEKVAASMRFVESAMVRHVATMARLSRVYRDPDTRLPIPIPTRAGPITLEGASTRITQKISRLTGLPAREISSAISYYKRAQLLSGIISNTGRYNQDMEQSELFEQTNRQIRRYNKMATHRGIGSPVIPLTLDPAETQTAAFGALNSISQQMGLLLPRRAISLLPPETTRALAAPNAIKGSVYKNIVGRLAGIEKTDFNIPPQFIRAFDAYIAKFGPYNPAPRLSIPPRVSVPTSGRVISPNPARLSSYLGPAFASMAEMRAVTEYDPFQSLRTGEQYAEMLGPELTAHNRRFTKFISSPMAWESLKRRGAIPRTNKPLLFDPTGGADDIAAEAAAQAARIKAGTKAGAAAGGSAGAAAGEEDPFVKYFKNDPFVRGMFRGQSAPNSEYIRYLARIKRRDIFQGMNERYTPFRGFGPGLNEEEYMGQLVQGDIFQGNKFGYYPPGGGGPPNKSPRKGAGGAGGGGFLSKFAGRFGGLAMYLGAGALLYPLVGGMYKTLENAKELETTLTRIYAIYGKTTLSDQLAIKKDIVSTAQQLSTDLLETARAAQLLAQEGMGPKDFGSNLRAIAQGSIGMGVQQEGLANYVIAVRNATANPMTGVSKLGGQDAIDLLAAFYRKGAVSPQNLMTSIQQILPSMEAFSPKEGGISDPAIIGAITQQVARRTSFTGSQVSNAVRYFIARFGSPDTAAEIERLSGINLGTKASGGQELRPFQDILGDLAKKYGEFNAGGQASRGQAMLKNLFGLRQVGVGGNILQSWDEIRKEATAAERDHASAASLATQAQETLNAQLERLATTFTSTGESVLQFIKQLGVGAGYLIAPDAVMGRNVSTHEWAATILAGITSLGVLPMDKMYSFWDTVVPGWSTPGPAGGPIPGLPPSLLPGARGYPARNMMERPRNALPQNIFELGDAMVAQYPITPIAPEVLKDKGSMSDETAPLFDPRNWTSFYRRYQSVRRKITGQDFVSGLLGMKGQDPERELQQMMSLMEGFYSAIGAENRPKGTSLYKWVQEKDESLYNEPLKAYNYLHSRFQDVQMRAIAKRGADFNYEEQFRRAAEDRRSNFAIGRMSLRLRKSFGRRGLTPTIGEQLFDSLDEISAQKGATTTEQNANYGSELYKLQQKFTSGGMTPETFVEEKRQLDERNISELRTIEHKYKEMELDAEITAAYETRLKIVQQIEKLSEEINQGVRGALFALPGMTKTRGVAGHFLGPILQSSAAAMYGSLVSRVNLFGREGLFPGVGKTLNDTVGPVPDYTAVSSPPLMGLTGIGALFNGASTGKMQTPEQLRKAQRDAQIKALEIALAATVGAYVGKGGAGAQVGSQLGAIGGMALGAKLGSAGGPIGALVGGIIGGLVGGIFDKPKKKPPELVALEKIERNTNESTTLIENTNRLLELSSLAFNVPTGFSLPIYNPSLGGGMGMGGGQVVANSINVEVKVGIATSSPDEIGQVVAQAVSDRLEVEYRNAGSYVTRTGY